MKKTLVVNLYGGPGSCKSTMMAGIFSELKFRRVNCEMALEFAKSLVWDESLSIVKDQTYVFSKQYRSIYKVMGKVDVVITDSPILLSIVYDIHKDEDLKKLIISKYNKHWNLDIFLIRPVEFEQAGRVQDREQSIEKDEEIRYMLEENKVPFIIKTPSRNTVLDICDIIEKMIYRNG